MTRGAPMSIVRALGVIEVGSAERAARPRPCVRLRVAAGELVGALLLKAPARVVGDPLLRLFVHRLALTGKREVRVGRGRVPGAAVEVAAAGREPRMAAYPWLRGQLPSATPLRNETPGGSEGAPQPCANRSRSG
jgi:hypothetical protein